MAAHGGGTQEDFLKRDESLKRPSFGKNGHRGKNKTRHK